jgi:hypothetical protein
MGFPPLGIETLAPVIREAGHEVVMYDTCHPYMRAEHIAHDLVEMEPDVIALSFLSPYCLLILAGYACKAGRNTCAEGDP